MTARRWRCVREQWFSAEPTTDKIECRDEFCYLTTKRIRPYLQFFNTFVKMGDIFHLSSCIIFRACFFFLSRNEAKNLRYIHYVYVLRITYLLYVYCVVIKVFFFLSLSSSNGSGDVYFTIFIWRLSFIGIFNLIFDIADNIAHILFVSSLLSQSLSQMSFILGFRIELSRENQIHCKYSVHTSNGANMLNWTIFGAKYPFIRFALR